MQARKFLSIDTTFCSAAPVYGRVKATTHLEENAIDVISAQALEAADDLVRDVVAYVAHRAEQEETVAWQHDIAAVCSRANSTTDVNICSFWRKALNRAVDAAKVNAGS